MREVPCPYCEGKGYYYDDGDCGATGMTKTCYLCEGSGTMLVVEEKDLGGEAQ